MEPLPAHIRPEDEDYFRQPLPLAPMSTRARWVLGWKVLIAAQLIWLPISLFFNVTYHFKDRIPAFIPVAGIVACIVFAPLWASGIFRAWVASALVQRLLSQIVASPAGSPKNDSATQPMA